MDQVISFLSRIEVLIAIGVLLILIIVLLIARRMKFKSYKKEFDELNIQYNSIKSVPLNFKLNKAVAIARVNQSTMDTITQCKDDYDKIQANFEELSRLLAETDDNITIHKAKLIKYNLVDLRNCIDIGKEQVGKLETILDSILERENEQRTRVTELKEAFRDVKSNIAEQAQIISISYPTIEKRLEEIESLFSVFEEYIYASEFEKSKNLLEEINTKIQKLENTRLALPSLIEKGKGIIPSLMDELKREHALSMQRGTYLEHLNIDKNIEFINENLKNDLAAIEQLKLDKVNDSLDGISVRLSQLHKQLHDETEAFVEAKQISKGFDEEFIKVNVLLAEVREIYPKVESRFGVVKLSTDLNSYDTKLAELTRIKDELKIKVQSCLEPASTINNQAREVAQEIDIMTKELTSARDGLVQASQDERRAQKQLLKLQLITNEMQVKIIKNKLPSISKQFESDVKKAQTKINVIQDILDQLPIDINKLNYELNEAIDYIYKLYNDVNNIVGMAIMVEHTIVFGNKYRSTHPDLDSELTRSELCYRNGEYTQALEIAIASIEKLFPNSYDKLIKENALSAK